MRKFLKLAAASTVALAFVAAASQAFASTALVTNEAGITNNGNLSWGVLGASFTNVTNPFTLSVPGVSGLTITGSEDVGTSFERRDEGNGWAGNFANAEQLLWSGGSNGPMVFDFNQGIQGFGAQIQANSFGAFTARIEAFNAANVSLGFFTLNGVSTSSGDDSAIFIGILSTALDIRHIMIGTPVTSGGIEDFAINSPRIQTTGSSTPVPEPASTLLLGTGLASLVARRTRKPRA